MSSVAIQTCYRENLTGDGSHRGDHYRCNPNMLSRERYRVFPSAARYSRCNPNMLSREPREHNQAETQSEMLQSKHAIARTVSGLYSPVRTLELQSKHAIARTRSIFSHLSVSRRLKLQSKHAIARTWGVGLHDERNNTVAIQTCYRENLGIGALSY